MGKKTNKTQEQSTTQYSEWKPSSTPDIEAYRGMSDTPESLAPSLQAQFDRSQQRNANRLGSSYNQNIPNSARLAQQANYDRDSTADYGAALGQSAYDAKQLAQQRRLALAGLTVGRPLATSTSGTQTQTQSGGLLGQILGGAATGAMAFI